MATPKIVVLTAGMSLHSSSALLADRLKDATRAELQTAGVEAGVHTYHLSQFAHEIADHLTMGFPSGELTGLLKALREADAIITVSPTFKASYSGLFKSLWDLTEDGDVDGTPILLGATGGSPRHSLMIEQSMRPLFTYLHADVVTTAVFAATDDFGAENALESRVTRAGRELAQKMLWRLSSSEPLDHDDAARPAQDTAATEKVEEKIVEEEREGDFDPGQDAGHQESRSGLKVTPFEELLKG